MENISVSNFVYTGSELQIFKLAKNWKNYYKANISSYIQDGAVLEIGAGIGEMTRVLRPNNPNVEWVCVEPDRANVCAIRDLIQSGVIDKEIQIFEGNVENYRRDADSFSTALFIDSLEHIEDDENTLKHISNLVKSGGAIIIIVPAHNFLYSEFDHKIGHFRRYNKRMLRNILPNSLQELSCRYIDSVGFFLSMANKLFLKSSDPTKKQILFWDTVIVPFSKILDAILGYSFGKNLILVAVKK
jgi:2-polyprenyl-3-methyl-5-hydroxy-6-metoxy-1,4-benzoquinol methylase